MILDRLERAERYGSMHPRFPRAFQFLAEADWQSIDDGRHEIEGNEIFVLVSTSEGRGRQKSPLEVHRRYIDIQMVLEGTDEIGWRSLDSLVVSGEFDQQGDIGMLAEPPHCWLVVPRHCFTVFFPHDAHAPLAGSGRVRKAVVKVAV
jgi:YhcH/YjgK/YiaL family protein